jgi:hypothetical protein
MELIMKGSDGVDGQVGVWVRAHDGGGMGVPVRRGDGYLLSTTDDMEARHCYVHPAKAIEETGSLGFGVSRPEGRPPNDDAPYDYSRS